ncbi:MAG: hypothetical protein CL503_03605 [Actinobacteria bacterium]|nr:hypothetical protein [Actinomycetota bacterium]|tara:strand:+ start:4787 stop:6145 length:1359 start_codon:yes stop_codon:yes gene_type:complete
MKQFDYQAFFITNGLAFEEAVQRYDTRRRQLLAKCSHITLLSGVATPLSHHNIWLMPDVALYQDPVMLYLTGLNQLNVGLILDPFQDKISLCLPKKDDNQVFWEGDFLGLSELNHQEICERFLVDDVLIYEDIAESVVSLIHDTKDLTLALYWHDHESEEIADFYVLFKKMMEEALEEVDVNFVNCFHLLEDRVILDDVDRANLKQANQFTADVFKTVCKALAGCSWETEVAGILKGNIFKYSWMGQSFPAIVASGKNATILHYKHHNHRLDQDALLLLDFGCRYEVMPADISRTVPVNGRFNPLQRLLYTIVLEAQITVEKHVKEGITIDELNELCWSYIEAELDKRFFSKGGSCQRSYVKQPHNVSHLIGHMVHDGDPFRVYRSLPLQSGMVISIEPGIYGHFSIDIDGNVYDEELGIRIEDNVVVTGDGCDNLSSDCPKSVLDIEALCS